jgi:hypothetical protein
LIISSILSNVVAYFIMLQRNIGATSSIFRSGSGLDSGLKSRKILVFTLDLSIFMGFSPKLAWSVQNPGHYATLRSLSWIPSPPRPARRMRNGT